MPRKTLSAPLALVALTMIPGAAQAADAAAASASASVKALAYPDTARGDTIDPQFGVDVADPYRWLEDDVRVNPKVADWVVEQNKVTDAYLDTLPGRDTFKKRMTELYNYERFGLPTKAGTRYFYSRNDGLQPQSVLYVREGLKGEGRVLIDPNSWAKDGATALGEWNPSEDGKHLLYSVQDGGTDWRIVRVKDVATGQDLSDEVRWVKFSALDWAKDGSGFYYSRFPEPKEGEAFQSLNENHSVYFHKLGTPQSADVLIHATPDKPKLNNSAVVTDDGKYLLVVSSEGTDERYGLTLYPTDKRSAKPIVLVDDFANNWEYVTNEGPRFTFVTNKGAPRGRLVSLDIKKSAALTELAGENEATLVGASRVGNRIILSYLGDAKSEARMIALDGKPVANINLADIGSASGFGGKSSDPETFYAFSSYARPTTIYRFDTQTGRSEIFAEPKLTFKPADFSVEQRFYKSKDGTEVPMFLVMKKGLDRSKGSPTLLYGYGGFNVSMTPGFSPTRLAWVDKGGVLAIANLRGGGEYGKAWHDAGRLDKKQNVFDDFIAAGEYLIAEGIAGKGQIAIEGGSNGGLLVGAVTNQRPDLFAAALPAVGVMDMLRFDRFTAGRYWVDDYGYPSKEGDFKNLLAYSPYHNIKDGTAYPAVLVTTADTDDRVVPGHSFKYTAALQHAKAGDKPHLIRVETRAGHGSGKPTDKIIAEAADKYAFAAKWTGLSVE
ncbi:MULTISPECIES: prolyl oligopeptidase family protein [unclassified Sphingopyxis]|jgi:prolyl oligopeptidase|uniref:prolyl oligopeptidase family serine peptidase n=1 Tax=unclassified Sphingopyxis TaxID=2614943 RepID=UPI0006C291E8|nr:MULTISPECIES: prolyl oligopeptidase family serine peptidase [unclassified Sphingopyxis]USI76160.1 prolyl oligopeptidase family serine peptidase [Sphingopyxis sp. USTB-05]GAO77140.1 prolyl endopeptidase [Sphingopyxis sp. C-1]